MTRWQCGAGGVGGVVTVTGTQLFFSFNPLNVCCRAALVVTQDGNVRIPAAVNTVLRNATLPLPTPPPQPPEDQQLTHQSVANKSACRYFDFPSSPSSHSCLYFCFHGGSCKNSGPSVVVSLMVSWRQDEKSAAFFFFRGVRASLLAPPLGLVVMVVMVVMVVVVVTIN